MAGDDVVMSIFSLSTMFIVHCMVHSVDAKFAGSYYRDIYLHSHAGFPKQDYARRLAPPCAVLSRWCTAAVRCRWGWDQGSVLAKIGADFLKPKSIILCGRRKNDLPA